ncbi:MAG: homogentisate 1,2-dioxygenase [Oscillatoriales cyanobacterium RU_3_3]|nr:homogentisate 1,2-dioxygenase [Oscillatoriales cyanobacterium RU_3_3]
MLVWTWSVTYWSVCRNEFMGLIRGVYEAKQEGFLPGVLAACTHIQAHAADAHCFTRFNAA